MLEIQPQQPIPLPGITSWTLGIGSWRNSAGHKLTKTPLAKRALKLIALI